MANHKDWGWKPSFAGHKIYCEGWDRIWGNKEHGQLSTHLVCGYCHKESTGASMYYDATTGLYMCLECKRKAG